MAITLLFCVLLQQIGYQIKAKFPLHTGKAVTLCFSLLFWIQNILLLVRRNFFFLKLISNTSILLITCFFFLFKSLYYFSSQFFILKHDLKHTYFHFLPPPILGVTYIFSLYTSTSTHCTADWESWTHQQLMPLKIQNKGR